MIINCIHDSSNHNLLAAFIGGSIGAILGVISTLLSAYYGPKWLKERESKELEEKLNGPRKRLLLKLLTDQSFEFRSLKMLTMVTGTTAEECRRLLIEIDARGAFMKGGEEGWALISRKPIIEE
jgi:hypothetical protein